VARDHLLRMPVQVVAPPTLFTTAWELSVELERPQASDRFPDALIAALPANCPRSLVRQVHSFGVAGRKGAGADVCSRPRFGVTPWLAGAYTKRLALLRQAQLWSPLWGSDDTQQG